MYAKRTPLQPAFGLSHPGFYGNNISIIIFLSSFETCPPRSTVHVHGNHIFKLRFTYFLEDTKDRTGLLNVFRLQ